MVTSSPNLSPRISDYLIKANWNILHSEIKVPSICCCCLVYLFGDYLAMMSRLSLDSSTNPPAKHSSQELTGTAGIYHNAQPSIWFSWMKNIFHIHTKRIFTSKQKILPRWNTKQIELENIQLVRKGVLKKKGLWYSSMVEPSMWEVLGSVPSTTHYPNKQTKDSYRNFCMWPLYKNIW